MDISIRPKPLDFDFPNPTLRIKENLEITSPVRFSSVFSRFKYLCIFAKLQGCLPIQKLFRAKSTKELTFKKLSLSYLLSVFCIFIKLLILYDVFIGTNNNVHKNISHSSNQTLSIESIKNSSVVQKIAESASLIVHFFFGIIAHLIILHQTKYFLQLIQLLEDYENKFPTKPTNIPKLGDCKTKTCIVQSTFTIICAAFFIYIKNFMVHNARGLAKLFDFSVASELATFIHLALIIIIEYGTLFLYIQLFYMGKVIVKAIADITEEINVGVESVDSLDQRQRAFVGEVNKSDLTTVWGQPYKLKSNPWAQRVSRLKWTDLGNRYLQLTQIVELYEVFACPYLIIALSFLILSAVFSMFITSGNSHESASNSWIFALANQFFYKGTTVIAFGRIDLLTSLGEAFQQVYSNLVKSIAKFSLNQNLGGSDVDEFNLFRKLVASIPVKLSAGGYFTVSKSNVTSITGVIITYLVVLWQFKTST